MFKDNPEYTLQFESKMFDVNGAPLVEGAEPLRYYSLSDFSNYHTSRYVAATGQNIYSASGITPELQTAICDQIIKAVNEKKLADCAVLANNLKYRTKYPVDENAIMRMAMIYMFVEKEDPNKCENHWIEWKIKRVLEEPEAYSFFLPVGLELTPAYNQYSAEVSQISLRERSLRLEALQPMSELK